MTQFSNSLVLQALEEELRRLNITYQAGKVTLHDDIQRLVVLIESKHTMILFWMASDDTLAATEYPKSNPIHKIPEKLLGQTPINDPKTYAQFLDTILKNFQTHE